MHAWVPVHEVIKPHFGLQYSTFPLPLQKKRKIGTRGSQYKARGELLHRAQGAPEKSFSFIFWRSPCSFGEAPKWGVQKERKKGRVLDLGELVFL